MPSTRSKKRKVKEQGCATSQQDKRNRSEEETSGRQIDSFTDAYLQDLLQSLTTKDQREEYADLIRKEVEENKSKINVFEILRLCDWFKRFRGERLGSNFSTLGYGSMSGKQENMDAIDEVITSCEQKDDDRKGRMLSHVYYRAFLSHIHDKSDRSIANNEVNKERFKRACTLIWQESKTGVVCKKRRDGNTYEACATSLLAAYIGNAIQAVTKGDPLMPVWTNEFPLYGSGHLEEGKKGGSRQPVCDGLLVMPDPKKENSLRALVMMEAKINDFVLADRYQSRSNAVDAFSRQPNGDHAWPLLVFRSTINRNGTAVKVLALVPTSEKKGILVPVWESTDIDSLYNAVMASVVAAKAFREELQKKGEQLFCRTGKNVAIEGEEKVFKSFLSTNRRSPNLRLIQAYVDKDAKEYPLGDNGCYIRMKYAGEALPSEVEVSKFVSVADTLAHAHSNEDTCHGDLRIDNMILGSGTLIDWDLAGKANERKYPKGLNQIVDGERHPEVQDAINAGRIEKLALKKEHDWHSLKAAMGLFEPKDPENKQAWTNLIDNIQRDRARADARTCSFFVKLNEKALQQRKERYSGGPFIVTGSAHSPS